MFDLFSSMSEGMMLVDRSGRVVWINESYKRFLPALGFERAEDFVGKPVEQVVPNTLMRHVLESGKPILLDLLTNKAGTFVVSRIPLRDETGEVIGVLGMVLFDHPETTLQPLIGQVARFQKNPTEARRALLDEAAPEDHIPGYRPAWGQDWLSARPPTSAEAREFGIKRGSPVLIASCRRFDASDSAIEYAELVARADTRVEYRYEYLPETR